MKTSLTAVLSGILLALVLAVPVAQAQEAAPQSPSLFQWLSNLVPDSNTEETAVAVAPLNTAAPNQEVAANNIPHKRGYIPASPVAELLPPPSKDGTGNIPVASVQDIAAARAAGITLSAASTTAALPAAPVKSGKKANMKSWKSGQKGARRAQKKLVNGLDPKYVRTEVRYETEYEVGTIVIDPDAKYLYLVAENGMALRYGVGVGRAGFEWSGTAKIKRKAEWPTWTPPAAMRKREPWLPARMEGGIENPLGARAMYLYQGGRDTLYRIHGTNNPSTIGKAVSSGCIRLVNADVADLYNRTPMGTTVVVLPSTQNS